MIHYGWFIMVGYAQLEFISIFLVVKLIMLIVLLDFNLIVVVII